MSNAAFGYTNLILNTTWLGAGSEVSGLGVGNLQDQQTSDASSWRSSGRVSGQWVQGFTSARVKWRAFGLFRTNLTAAATVQWEVTDGGVAVYNSGAIPAGVVSGIGQTVHVAPSDVTGDGFSCSIDDPNNPDGFLSIGGAYAGPIWRPAINLSPQTALAHNRTRKVVTTRSGAQYVTPLYMQRGWEIAHNDLAQADLWTKFWSLDQASHLGQNILFIPDSDSPNVQAEAVFGLFEVTSSITFQTPGGEYRAWRGRILERI